MIATGRGIADVGRIEHSDTHHEPEDEHVEPFLRMAGRGIELTSVLPVPSLTLKMSLRDDDNLARADTVDDLVRNTGYDQPAGLLIGEHRVPDLGIHR